MSDQLINKLKLNTTSNLVVLFDHEQLYFTNSHISRIYPTSPADAIVLFVTDASSLHTEVFNIINQDLLTLNGRLFVAYPKKGNKRFDTFVSRDEIHTLLEMDDERYAKGSDYKFNQLMSLDDTYSLMVLKKVNKSKTKKIDACGRTSTYTDLLPTLEEALLPFESAYTFFQTLTPGYKNSWTRYIYSAKQEATRQKRLSETIDLLNQGVKTKN